MMETQDTRNKGLPARGRHSKPAVHGSSAAKDVLKGDSHHGKHIPEKKDWKFSAIALGLSLLAILSGLAYSAFSAFNVFCPAGSGGSCTRVPFSSSGLVLETLAFVLFVGLTIISALLAVEGIARIAGVVKAYITLSLLLLMTVLVSAGIIQDLIEKIVVSFLG